MGDCTAAAPGMFDFTGKAKHEAWVSVKGTSGDDARRAYIAAVEAKLGAAV